MSDGCGYEYETYIYPADRVRGSYYPYPTRPVGIPNYKQLKLEINN